MKFPLHRLRAPILAALVSTGVSPAEVRLLTGGSDNVPHGHNSDVVAISADGDKVLFISGKPVSGPSPGIAAGGVYLRVISQDTLEFVGGSESDAASLGDLSDDGRYLTWSSDVPLTGPGNGIHIFWRDRQTNTTRRITAGAQVNCLNPVMSADGRYVTFVTHDRGLVTDPAKLPASGRLAVFLYDSQATTGNGLSIISLRGDGSGLATGVGASSAALYEYDFSKDGSYVAFSTDSAGMHADTTAGGRYHVYRRKLSDGTITVMNRNPTGVVAGDAFAAFTTPRISRNGSRVAFVGTLVAAFGGPKMMDAVPGHLGAEIYVKDASGPAWRVTTTETGSAGGAAQDGFLSGRIGINGDGDGVAFACSAKNLVVENTEAPETENSSFDIFRADLPAGGGASLVSQISKSPALLANVDYTSGPVVPGSGAYVAFNTHDVNEMMGTSAAAFGHNHGFAVGTLPAVVPSGTTYAQWAAALPAGDRDHEDEPAGDGLENLLKYFVGMAPLVTDTSLLPVEGRQPGTALGLAGDTQEYLTLDLRVRRVLPAGFTWKVVCASNPALLAGSTSLAVQAGPPTADGDFDLYRFRYPAPMTAAARGFMHLAVEAP